VLVNDTIRARKMSLVKRQEGSTCFGFAEAADPTGSRRYRIVNDPGVGALSSFVIAVLRVRFFPPQSISTESSGSMLFFCATRGLIRNDYGAIK